MFALNEIIHLLQQAKNESGTTQDQTKLRNRLYLQAMNFTQIYGSLDERAQRDLTVVPLYNITYISYIVSKFLN